MLRRNRRGCLESRSTPEGAAGPQPGSSQRTLGRVPTHSHTPTSVLGLQPSALDWPPESVAAGLLQSEGALTLA